MTKATQWGPSLENILDACPAATWSEMVWAIGSAPLMEGDSKKLPALWQSNYHQKALTSLQDQLSLWAEISDPKSEVLGTMQMRLGKRFEQLVNWWFEASPEYSVLAKNIIVQGQDRTLGEMDLIVQDNASSEVIHLELACKFYLQTESSQAWPKWIGMDPKDQLDHKLSKLQDQLNLDRRPEAQALLRKDGIEIDTRAAWIKGWFFVHFREATRARLPHHAHRSVSTGWWCFQSEWETIWQPRTSWIIIPSQHWLRTRHKRDEVCLMRSADDAKNAMKQWKHVMVAQVEINHNHWQEVMRGIIVQDGWPFAHT